MKVFIGCTFIRVEVFPVSIISSVRVLFFMGVFLSPVVFYFYYFGYRIFLFEVVYYIFGSVDIVCVIFYYVIYENMFL